MVTDGCLTTWSGTRVLSVNHVAGVITPQLLELTKLMNSLPVTFYLSRINLVSVGLVDTYI